jgi:hypothetical protein
MLRSVGVDRGGRGRRTPGHSRRGEAGSEYAFGVGCALSNLVYGPAKLLFATGGAIVSGFAWVFSADRRELRWFELSSVTGDGVSKLLGALEAEMARLRGATG